MVGQAYPNWRVLLIDDDARHAKLFQYFLSKSDCPVEMLDVALSIDAAEAQLHAHAPHIVFLDNRMPPEIDYRANLERLRGLGYDGPVIVCSASIDDPVFEDGRPNGVAAIIDKGAIRPESLKQLIEGYAAPHSDRMAQAHH